MSNNFVSQKFFLGPIFWEIEGLWKISWKILEKWIQYSGVLWCKHHFRSLWPALYFGWNTVKIEFKHFSISSFPLNFWLRPLRGKRQPATLADPDGTPFWSPWPKLYDGRKRREVESWGIWNWMTPAISNIDSGMKACPQCAHWTQSMDSTPLRKPIWAWRHCPHWWKKCKTIGHVEISYII